METVLNQLSANLANNGEYSLYCIDFFLGVKRGLLNRDLAGLSEVTVPVVNHLELMG